MCIGLLLLFGGGGGVGLLGVRVSPRVNMELMKLGVWLLNRPETRNSGLNVCAATLSNTDSN
jgi:hypothetical protein